MLLVWPAISDKMGEAAQVTVCRKEDLAQYISDADMAIPLGARLSGDLIKNSRLKLILQVNATSIHVCIRANKKYDHQTLWCLHGKGANGRCLANVVYRTPDIARCISATGLHNQGEMEKCL